MDAGLPYLAWEDGLEQERRETRRRLQIYNALAPEESARAAELLREILGSCGENACIEPPFRCDYGRNFTVGENFYANYNLVVLDVGKVSVGRDVRIGPNVGLYAAGHPLHPDPRRAGWEYGADIVIGDDVWIGGSACVLAGGLHRPGHRGGRRQRGEPGPAGRRAGGGQSLPGAPAHHKGGPPLLFSRPAVRTGAGGPPAGFPWGRTRSPGPRRLRFAGRRKRSAGADNPPGQRGQRQDHPGPGAPPPLAGLRAAGFAPVPGRRPAGDALRPGRPGPGGPAPCWRICKFYITTPIYYPSDKLHIGHTYCTVATDAMASYKRMCGYDVMFLTGTDEHGQKIEDQGQGSRRHAEAVRGQHRRGPRGVKDLWKLMNISNDRFIRTTDDYHVESIQKIFKKMYDNGDIYKGAYKGMYCTPCESFWTESQLVDGKCPDCGRDRCTTRRRRPISSA
jgi:acetyltransferase-like isoleucine patch superfamily enzyme